MSIGITSIERACGPVLVGLMSIQLIEPADVVTMSRRGVSGLYESNLVLRAGTQLIDIDADSGTAAYIERHQGNDAGDTYRQSLTYRLRKLRPQLTEHRTRLRNSRAHLLITDAYGQKLWLPYMRLSPQVENGPRGGRNYATVNWQSSSALPAAYLNAEIITQDGEVLVGAILQSPDNSYWKIAVGLCGSPIAVSTNSTDIIAAIFRIPDSADNPYLLSVDNHGTLSVAASPGDVGELTISAPNGDQYLFSVTDCETLLTTRQNSDLPGGGNQNLGG